MGVERVRAGVECVRAGVEDGGIEGTREWANMGWEFESETRENYIVYIPRMPMNGRGQKKSPPTHICGEGGDGDGRRLRRREDE